MDVQSLWHEVPNTMSTKQMKQLKQKQKKTIKQEETFIQNRNRLWKERGGLRGAGPAQYVGSALGGYMGAGFGMSALGSALGGALGHGVGYLTGTGDYTMHNFRSIRNNACTVPGFNKNNDSATITHREYIQDVISGTGTPSVFTTTVLAINPGQQTTFPWLASIAANYEEYELQGMVFEYVATSGESVASANTALGTVIMATEYDPTKPAFANKQAMENYSFATSSKPACSFLHAIECKKERTPVNRLYVRTGANSGTDLRWTDFGNFTIATVGTQAAGTTLGELWVTYKIKLLKPRLPITLGLGGQEETGHVARTGSTSAAPLGTTTFASSGALALAITGTTITWFSPPGSTWLVTVSINAATSATALVASTLVGANNINIFNSDTTSAVTQGGAITSITQLAHISTNTNNGGNIVLTFNANVIVGAASTDIIVTQMDNTVVR